METKFSMQTTKITTRLWDAQADLSLSLSVYTVPEVRYPTLRLISYKCDSEESHKTLNVY